MALDGDRLGVAIATAITAAKPADGAAMSSSELESMCKTIAGEIIDEFTNNGQVSTSGATGSGPAGGPLPITSQPGTIL